MSSGAAVNRVSGASYSIVNVRNRPARKSQGPGKLRRKDITMAYHTHSIIRLGDGHTLHQIDGYQLSREDKVNNFKTAASADLAVGILKIDQEDCWTDHDAIARQMEMTTEAIACGMRDHGDYIHQWWIYPPHMTDFQIEKDLEAQGFRTEQEHCTHAYDCCARWHSDGVWIRRTETRVLATISISRNV